MKSSAGDGRGERRRLVSLDTLRALAIVLMVTDHVAMLLAGMSIEVGNVRFFSRLAEPLFAVLFGYLLAGRGRRRVLSRVWQLALAALAVNVLFVATFHKAEILATFTLVVAAYLALGERLVLLLPVVLLASLDPTGGFLDYPLLVVLAQTALGMLLRTSPRWGLVAALAFVPAALPLPAHESYKLLFTLPVVILVLLAVRRPGISLPVLTPLGRRPLTAYVTQWGLVYAAVAAVALAGGGGAPRWALQRMQASFGLSDQEPDGCLERQLALLEQQTRDLSIAVRRGDLGPDEARERRRELVSTHTEALGRCEAPSSLSL